MDHTRILVGLVFIISTTTTCSGQTFAKDPCSPSEHKRIDEPHRSTGFVTAPPETPLCDDRLRRGWYQFSSMAGSDMPTSCQETNRCGTTKPIWLDGSNPTEEEGIVMQKICVNMNNSDPDARPCCEYSEDIFVKNCGTFYVYYLYPTIECDMAYCAGSVPPCPVGKWSNTSFPPCKDSFPVLEEPPRVTGPNIQSDQTVGFQCEVIYGEYDPDQRFEVVWTFNGITDSSIASSILSGDERTAILDVGSAKTHVDSDIACQVRSYYVGRESYKSDFLTSNKTYFGLKSPPVLTGPFLADNKSFAFQCNVGCYNDSWHQEFEVIWTFDGRQDPGLSSQRLTGSDRTALLDGAFIKGHLNTKVACQARLIYQGSDVRTKFVNSNTYFVGIQMSPDPLEMSETDTEKQVTVSSTIPIVCDGLDNDCCLTVRLNVNETSAVSLTDTCEYRMCSSDWDPDRSKASIQIGIVPTRNILVGDNRGVFLSLEVAVPSDNSTYLQLFQGYSPSRLQVTITDAAASKCSLTGDPHIMGFDFKYMYDLYKSGDFIAYQAPYRDFMVQVRTVPCGGGSVACICGIVVRERDNVIKISKCSSPIYGQATIDIAYKLSPGVIVQRSADGYRFGIYLASGSEVKIESGGTNVFISIPAVDNGFGMGLCGTNDGLEDNDFTHPDGTVDTPCQQRCIPDAFLESWRVSGNESLFEVVPDPVNDTDPVRGSSSQYCSCLRTLDGNSSISCSERQHVVIANTACPNCPVITDILTPSYKVGVGWVKPGSDKPEPAFVHPEAKPVDKNKQWPNDQGVTEAEGRDKCMKAVQMSQLYPRCQHLQAIIDPVISDCLADILYGGTTDFLDDVTSAFTTQCQLKLAQNPDSYQTNDNGDKELKPDLINICPVECLKHGQCGEKGVCHCQDGWEGETCLIDSKKGPELVMIQSGAVCDKSLRSCVSITIEVTNINFLDGLVCRVQAVDEQDNDIGAPALASAVFLSPNIITCTIPATEHSTQQYFISASKTGTVFGNQLVLRVFDGICLQCNVTMCEDKSTACHIDKICYRNGEANKNDRNKTCDISKSTTKWTSTRSDQDQFPKLEVPPVLAGPSEFNTFKCEVVYPYDDPEQVFEVVWTFNGQAVASVPPQILTGAERVATLNILLLSDHIDKSVGCQVKGYYLGYESIKGPFLVSNTSYFGIEIPPTITGPIVSNNNKAFSFQCQVFYDNGNLSQEIEVAWTFNGQQDPALPAEVISQSDRTVVLDGARLAGHIGTKIGCQARLRFAGGSVKTAFVQSNIYFAGIQISPSPLEISEINFEKYITVTSTIPIICQHDLECCLTFRLNVSERSAVTLLNSCEHRMCTSDWNSTLKAATIQVGVVPTRDVLIQNNRKASVAFEVITTDSSGSYLDIFRNHRPSSLEVTVKDEKVFTCSIYTDPHIKGFDVISAYAWYSSGDYIAYTTKGRDFTIQIRTSPCVPGGASCVCGVVVKEKDDVIKVSKCEANTGGIPTVAVAYNLSSSTVIQRSSDGYRLGIHLPSGSEIRLERGGTNVYISVPAFDKGLGSGLCGTNDGIADNDFTHRNGTVDPVSTNDFFESWRVAGNESLFEVVPDPINTTDPVFGSSVQYCSCLETSDKNSSVTCSTRQFTVTPSTVCANCPEITTILTPSYLVGVGWVTPGTVNPLPPYVHPEVKPIDTNKQWPNGQGVTEDQAREFCTQALQKSQLYQHCQNLSQVTVPMITGCMEDILIGDTTDFLDDTTAAFTSNCQLALAEDPDSYINNTDGELVLKPELIDICPVECLQHGQCGDKGQCHCHDGWDGETCLVDTSKGPQLLEIKGQSVCDVTMTTCEDIQIRVSNVNYLHDLQIKIQEMDNEGNSVGAAILTKSTYSSPDTITCRLPALVNSTRRYMISASKDGTMYGNELVFRVFNGSCLQCDITECQTKTTSCHIDNVCYGNGEVDRNDANRTCDVTRSTTAWTVKRDSQNRYPILETAPLLVGPTVGRNGSVSFQCQVIYSGQDPEQVFEIVWTFNGQSHPAIPSQFLHGEDRIMTLDISLLKGQVDKHVGCQVRSYYIGYESEKSGFVVSTTTYFGIQIPPVLAGPIISDNKSFVFQCELADNVTDPWQKIEVMWTFNDQQDTDLLPEIINGSSRIVIMDGQHLKGHLNTRVGCQVRLIFPESDVTTSFIKSKTYYCGIQIQPDPLTISQVEFEKHVTVTSTIPVICESSDPDCCLTFRLNMNETSAVSLINSCEHKMCFSDWDSDKKSTSIQIGLVPTRNVLLAGSKDVYLAFQVRTPSDLDIFHNYQTQKLQVTITDETAFKCSLTGDPHISGFDTKYMYDLYKSGDFIAYQAPNRDFMVQVRTVPCGSGAVTCICGVVAKEKNNVVKITKCGNPNSGRTTVDIAYKLSPGTVVQRSSDGLRFGVYFPSGSEVKVEYGGTNVYLIIPAFDKGVGRGVCGTNDGIADNDFTHRDGTVDPTCNQRCIPDAFLESWRVAGNESLFEVVPEPSNSTDQVGGSSAQYCSCLEKPNGNSSVYCSARQYVQRTNTACTNCPVITDTLAPSYTVGIGWLQPGTNQPEPPFVHPEVKPVDKNKQWPNDQGITEVQARDICTQALRKSQLFSQCQNLEYLTNSVISDCLADILSGGTTDFLDETTSSFTSQCQIALAQNPDNYIPNTDGELVLKPELLDVCPVACLKHGRCGEKGRCHCQEGWEGETCLIDSSQGPQLLEIKGGCLCDVTQMSCNSVHIEVTNINFPDGLQCRTQEVDEQGNSVGSPVLAVAVFLSPTIISCTLPTVEQSLKNYLISATKDGVLFGNELLYRQFNSTCMECNATSCQQKKTACRINNVCYSNGDVDSDDSNKVCDVTKNISDWTLTNNNPPTAAPEPVDPTRPPRGQTVKPCHFCFGG